MKFKIVLIALIMMAQPVLGATVQGSVYDFSLEETEAVVTINSTPQQKIVAKGSYEFQVRPGTYTITAEGDEGRTEENFTIEEQGEYTIDLILFPNVDVEGLEVEDQNIDSQEFVYGNNKETWTYGLVIMIIFALLTMAYFYYARKEEDKEMEPDAKAVYEFIKSEKRTTQKEIRKQFPYSQAKVSMILTELEDKGLVKKVKKGRGNVIILN